jgi:DNA-binding Lrp family transcriptional regulator
MTVNPTPFPVSVDFLDLTIIESMLGNGRITFKELAKQTHSDQRTVANRYQRLVKLGIIEAATIQVNWSKIGFGAMATIGTTTLADEENRKKFLDFIDNECRVVEAFTAIGSREYTLRVLDKDIATLRKIITPLEPLTSGLDTSVAVERINNPGTYLYYCKYHTAVENNHFAGMVGEVIVLPSSSGPTLQDLSSHINSFSGQLTTATAIGTAGIILGIIGIGVAVSAKRKTK